MKIGKPTHFKLKDGSTACGLVGAEYTASDQRDVDCINCKKTKALYKALMGDNMTELPYDFDLCYDIKTTEELYDALDMGRIHIDVYELMDHYGIPRTRDGKPAMIKTEDGHQNNPVVPKVYTVLAFHYGTNRNVFPIGIFATREKAIEAAQEHRQYRGGKYNHRIYEFKTDYWDDNIGHAGTNNPCIED